MTNVSTRNGPNGDEIEVLVLDDTQTTGTRLSTNVLTLTSVYQATEDVSKVPMLGTAEIRTGEGTL